MLKTHGIVDGPSAFAHIRQLDPMETVKLLGECFDAVNGVSKEFSDRTLFNFAPTASLAGGIYPCSDINCRLEAAYRVAVFGGLYADTLILPNFFDYYYHLIQSEEYPFDSEESEQHFKYRVAADIAVSLAYRPLIESGLAVFNPTLLVMCKDCHKTHLAGTEEYRAKVDETATALEAILYGKLTFSLTRPNYISVSDPENYLGFGDGTGWNLNRSARKDFTKYLNRLPYELAKEQIAKLRLMDRLVDQAVDEILERNYYPWLQKSTYLTNSALASDILSGVRYDTPLLADNLGPGLYHQLPFLQDVLLEDVVRLREKCNDAFEVYRDALTAAVRDSAVPEVVNTVINPALHTINNTISSNVADVRARAGRKLLISTAVVAAGAASAALFHNSALLLTTAKAVVDVPGAIDELAKAGAPPVEARTNPYYFLWRVKHDAEHR